MSRRSLRLMSGGYYPPEEELDSSGMTNISYNENPVKVFKKKAGTRRASSNASSPSQESPVTAGQCDDSLSLMAVAAQLKIVHLKALGMLLVHVFESVFVCVLEVYGIWFLLPLVNSFILSGANTLSQTEPESPPVFSATAPPPPQPDTVHHEPVVEQHVLKESGADFGRPMADKMADFALETQGARVISARCSETYRIRSACVTLFGFPLWYPYETPRTVIRGYPALLPGKCWAFPGVQGTLSISLSHPVRITHVTLDHLSQHNSPTGQIDSAPKDFEVYGKENDTDEGTLLGTFTYDENGEPTQTFQLPQSPSDRVYRFVELRVLSNWGHDEYTCLYRFRVHGKIAST
ncbi:putative SUN domain-containing protein 1-like [Scophthalmus maximus]|uniref:Putative SUN domain-containing protein 1-like n=1 Tax=Scophthalmus maximus TaxID=52904 RepID=A0A2U9CHP8_SCOMX|nr:putative SUN domain-containing protein 1-like [Scophthalmus maximus]